MHQGNKLSRRGFLRAAAALGTVSLAACTTKTKLASSPLAADRPSARLPERGEFVVRSAHLLTMDPTSKRADLILVRTTDLNMAPLGDPVNAIVHSAQPYNVDTVVVDGRILKRGGKLTALDTEQVMREAAELLAEVRKRRGEI